MGGPSSSERGVTFGQIETPEPRSQTFGLLSDACHFQNEQKAAPDNHDELLRDLTDPDGDYDGKDWRAVSRRAAAAIRVLVGERDEARSAHDAEASAISAAIGTVEFMDPPDGGDVSLAEQVARMNAARQSAEAALAVAVEALDEALRAMIAVRVGWDHLPPKRDDATAWLVNTMKPAVLACKAAEPKATQALASMKEKAGG